jgi:hypothetical protein
MTETGVAASAGRRLLLCRHQPQARGENELQELFNHPAMQGGIAPFITSLIAAGLLRRWNLSGLALIAGFLVTAFMVGVLGLEPLTATRKTILLGVFAALLGIALTRITTRFMRSSLAFVGGMAAIWAVWRILQQHNEFLTALPWAVGCASYAGWLVFWSDRLHDKPVRAGSAGLALGVGTGVTALFGSSVILGMLGMSLGAASGAFLMLQLLGRRPLSCGRSFTLPLSLLAALVGCLGVLTASLPWYALLILAAIPSAAQIPVPKKSSVWLQSLQLSAVTLICAAGAIYLTWRVTGTPPI